MYQQKTPNGNKATSNGVKKILFIEDQPALQQVLAKILEEAGYKAISALDGEIGLELAQKEQPDLILLDLVLPKKDGFAVLKELKDTPATKHIPVIVLTNLERSEDIDRVLELGASTFLVKTNYQPDEIAQKIKDLIGS